jgi:hypothetical protein
MGMRGYSQILFHNSPQLSHSPHQTLQRGIHGAHTVFSPSTALIDCEPTQCSGRTHSGVFTVYTLYVEF